MLKLRIKYFTLFNALFFIGIISCAQKISGLNVGAEFGTSRFFMEIPTDFSRKIIEFDNEFGITTDVELTKYLSEHWEVGIDLSYTTLNGNSQNPSFSAEGKHSAIGNLKNPVEYKNKLLGQKIFTRFFLISLNNKLKEVNSYPFINLGVGLLSYKSKFKYIDAPKNDIIFGKGYDGFANLSTAVYSLGGGFKTSWSSKFFIVSSINCNFINYGFLDVIHNYDQTGEKMDVLGTYIDFKIGVFYSLTPIKTSDRKSKKGNKKRVSKGESHLPFAPK